MSKAKVDKERCKGCKLCIGNCPKVALEMSGKINSKGYKHVSIDTEKCIGCGICYTICPDGVFEIAEGV